MQIKKFLKINLRQLINTLKSYSVSFFTLFLNLEISKIPKELRFQQILNRKSKCLFFPYETFDCLLLHYSIARLIQKVFKSEIKILSYLQLRINPNRYIKKKKNNMTIDISWQNKLLEKLSDLNLSFLAPALIDSFKRDLDLEKILYGFDINDEFFLELKKKYQFVEKLAIKYEFLVIPDSAYILHAMLRHSFHSAGKTVYILHPCGIFEKLESTQKSECSISFDTFLDIQKKLGQNNYSVNLKLKNYVEFYNNRKSGKSVRDTDSVKAYMAKPNNLFNRNANKVLFMHCLRDASNLRPVSPKKDNYLSTLDWFIDTISIIADHQEEWIIKLHPSMNSYQGEYEIIERIFSFFKIKPTLYTTSPTTLQIINNNFFVYTYSGTIVNELATVGKKAIFLGSRYPNEIGHRAQNIYEWQEYLINPPKDLSHETTDNIKLSWIYLLGESLSRNQINSFVASRSFMPGDSFFTKSRLLKEQILNLLS